MNHTEHDWPLVSIGIPLYRAKSFVPRILNNIRSLDYPNLEFIIADQHGYDDAVTLLKEKLAEDGRVHFYETKDELDWIQNFNFVICHSHGKYFHIHSQDDWIPKSSIKPAVIRMESDSAITVIYGPVDYMGMNGCIYSPHNANPRRSKKSWNLFDSLFLFTGWRYSKANLGLVRRSMVKDSALIIPHTYKQSELSMRAWLFALSFRGRFEYEHEYRTIRCDHPENFGARTRQRSIITKMRILWTYFKIGCKIWIDSTNRRWVRIISLPVLMLMTFVIMPIRIFCRRIFDRQYRERVRFKRNMTPIK